MLQIEKRLGEVLTMIRMDRPSRDQFEPIVVRFCEGGHDPQVPATWTRPGPRRPLVFCDDCLAGLPATQAAVRP